MDFRYRLNSAPTAFNDGSACIAHDIDALVSQDEGESWAVVPGRHKSVLIPADELKVIMDMPDSTSSQKQAKTAAYKSSLVTNLNTQNTPITGWSITQMTAMVEANNAAVVESARANEYITVTLGQSYPVEFNL